MSINLKKSELAWLIGLWEGEGCFYITNAAYKGTKNLYPAMVIEMNDEDIIAKCAKLMDKTYAPTKHNTFRLTSSGRGAVPWMRLFQPFMGKRRSAKIQQIFDECTHKYDEIVIEDDE